MTIKRLAEDYRSGAQSPKAATELALSRISAQKDLNCFITVLEESARESAEASALRFKEGKPLGPLDGVPVAVKDIIYIKGVRCTAGSKILADNIAQYDAPVVSRLKAAGAVIIGTTNLHEFAAGVTSVNPHFGPVRNPWDQSRIAGGSSGGSAAAVSAGLCEAALGTDTAGSVRIPAALCGVVGMKPTYGRVSRLGVVPLAQSFDVVGTLTSCAWDAAALLRVIAGHEREDMTTTETPVPDYVAGLSRGKRDKMRVGIPKKYFGGIVDAGVLGAFDRFVSKLSEIGCEVVETEVDGIDETYGRWLAIRRAEATAFHMGWMERYGDLYGADVFRLLGLGRQVLAVDYVAAVNARPALMERFVSSMAGLDAVASPTTCVPATTIGDDKVMISGKEVEVYSAMNRLTLPYSYVGFPAVSIPAGTAKGLPVGVQLSARPFEEGALLALCDVYEETFGPHPAPGQN